MDFLRYEKDFFYENMRFNQESKEYKKLDKIIKYLKETYSCFNPNLKNEIFTKKFLKKPQIIQLDTSTHLSKKIMTSCLNKLTLSNYSTIYKKIMLSVEVHDANELINMILKTCLDSKSYHELYVGLIFHIYDAGNQEIKDVIKDQINDYFSILFDKMFYISNDDKNESYRDFCDRLTSKSKTIYSVRVYMMFYLHFTFADNLFKKPQCLIHFIYKELKSHPSNDIKSIELLLLCLKECYEIRNDLSIPLITGDIIWKKLILFDSDLNNLLNNLLTDCKDSKIRFIILDLLDVLDKHFALEI